MFFYGHPLTLPQQRLPGQYGHCSWQEHALPPPDRDAGVGGKLAEEEAEEAVAAGSGVGGSPSRIKPTIDLAGDDPTIVLAARRRLAGVSSKTPLPDSWDPASLREGDLVHWLAPTTVGREDEDEKSAEPTSWMVGRVLSAFGAGEQLTVEVEPLRTRVGSKEPNPKRVLVSSGRIAPLGWVPLHDDGPQDPVQQECPGLSLEEVEAVERRVEAVLRAAAAVRVCAPDGTEDGDISSTGSSIGGSVGDHVGSLGGAVGGAFGGAGGPVPAVDMYTSDDKPSAMRLRELAHYACVELPDYVDYVVTLALSREDDRARLTKVLMAATRLVGAYLVDGTGNRLPPRLERMMLTLFLADKPTSYFYDNDGATMGSWKSAAAADGTMMYIPKYGASAFFVPTMNRFGAQGGYEAIMRRFEACEPEPAHLAELCVYLSAMSVSKWCFRPEFSVPYLARMHGALIERLSEPLSEADALALEAGAALTLGKEFMEWAQVWTRSRAERHDDLVEADAVIAFGVDVIQELVRRLQARMTPAAVRQASALVDCAVTGLSEGVQKSRGKPFVDKIKLQRRPLARWLLDEDVLLTLLQQADNVRVVRLLASSVRLVYTVGDESSPEIAPITDLLLSLAGSSDPQIKMEAQGLVASSIGS